MQEGIKTRHFISILLALAVITSPAKAWDGRILTSPEVTTYSYDNLNRLIVEDANTNPAGAGYTAEYEYDIVGNRGDTI